MLTPRDIQPVTIVGIAAILLLLLFVGVVVTMPPSMSKAIADHERIECWSLESSFMQQDGWVRAHRADKFADNPSREKLPAATPDTVCDVLDADGLPRRELRASHWWIRPGAKP
jgi:hypothetical protein